MISILLPGGLSFNMTAKDLHDIDKDLAVLQKEVDTQFREIFTRIKRLEAIMIGTSGTIILLLLKMLMER
jgi:hypothetical protein